MAPRLYVIPASHPCACAEAAFRVKGVAYDVTALPTVLHAAIQKARFGVRTVPALRADDGEKVVGSRAIVRWLDARHPDPPLFPADPVERGKVERAEEWGEQVLQPIGRRVVPWSVRRNLEAMPSYLEGSRLPMPDGVARRVAPLMVPLMQRINGAYEEPVRADVAALPGHLDLVDRWISEGVLGGEQANAADLQIGSTLALLSTLGDLEPLIASRPCGELVRRWFPAYPGRVPAGVLPG
jgi:glutathione S-transferase